MYRSVSFNTFGSVYLLPQSGNKYFEHIFVITTNDKGKIRLAVRHNTTYWQVPSSPIPISMPSLYFKTIFFLTSNTSINFAYMKSCSILSFAWHFCSHIYSCCHVITIEQWIAQYFIIFIAFLTRRIKKTFRLDNELNYVLCNGFWTLCYT